MRRSMSGGKVGFDMAYDRMDFGMLRPNGLAGTGLRGRTRPNREKETRATYEQAVVGHVNEANTAKVTLMAAADAMGHNAFNRAYASWLEGTT
jgi:hypothetical protein